MPKLLKSAVGTQFLFRVVGLVSDQEAERSYVLQIDSLAVRGGKPSHAQVRTSSWSSGRMSSAGELAEFDREGKRYHAMLDACDVTKQAQEDTFSGTLWRTLKERQNV